MLPDHALILTIAGLTTLVMGLLGRRWGVRRFGAGVVTAVELIGATTIFFIANLAVGSLLVLAIRKVTPFYPSLYEVADVALLLISLIQAAVVETWRRPKQGRMFDRAL